MILKCDEYKCLRNIFYIHLGQFVSKNRTGYFTALPERVTLVMSGSDFSSLFSLSTFDVQLFSLLSSLISTKYAGFSLSTETIF